MTPRALVRYSYLTPVLIVTLAAACSPAPERAAEAERTATVTFGHAERAELPTFHEAGGIVRARATAVIASRVMAPVAEVHARPGDRVRRGAPLVTLDARESRANRARSAAAFESAVEAARAAELESRMAEAHLTLARATSERIGALFAERAASAQERDQAVASFRAAEAQLGSARARVAAAHAAIDAARASIEADDIAVSYRGLAAPFDGVVTERSVDPGSMAGPGVPLLTVEDVSAFRLEVEIDEARAAAIEVGDAAEVRLGPDEPGGWTPATVVERARVDPASHTFLVKVALAPMPPMRSGRFGRVRFTGPSRRTLTVPSSALVRRGQLTFVFAVSGDGLARLRPVTTAAAAGDRVEVLAGVGDGERIVLNPPDSLADGTRVAAVQRQASAGGGR